MYVNVEIISNNTYKNTLFTYKVPSKIVSKVNIGSIVSVPFRNKNYKAVVLSKSKNSNVKNIKILNKFLNISLDNNQIRYLQHLAISNKLNVGILIHNLFDLSNYKDQQMLNTQKIDNIPFSKLEIMIKRKNNNVIFVPSLKIAKELYDKLSSITTINFYQLFGGKEEFLNKYNKNFKNIILLNTNFEKINLEENTNYYFYDSNHPAWKMPKLNNLNITEAAYLKQKIFGGSFFFINDFPNLEIKYHKTTSNYMRYLLSGGLNFKQLVPNFMERPIKFLEYLFTPFHSFTALHHVIVIKKCK